MSKDYQFSDDMLDEYESLVGYPNDVVDEKENPEYVKSGGYKALSVILTILGIGGLFVGLLSAVSELFAPLVEAGVDGMLNNTLLGVLLQVFAGFGGAGGITAPALDATKGLSGYAAVATYYLYFVLAAAIVLSILFTVIALIPQKATDKEKKPRALVCAKLNGLLLLLGYGGLFFSQLADNSYAYSVAAAVNNDPVAFRYLIDAPTGIMAAVISLALIIAAIAQRKGKGLLNSLVYLLSAAAVFALFYPQTAAGNLLFSVNNAFASGEGVAELSMLLKIAAFATFALAIFNLIVSAIRLGAKRAYVFDLVRFLLLFAAALTLAIALVLQGETPDWTAFAALPVILLLASAFAATLISLLAMLIFRKKKTEEAPQEEEDEFEHSFFDEPSPAAPAPEPQPQPQPQPTIITTQPVMPAQPIVTPQQPVIIQPVITPTPTQPEANMIQYIHSDDDEDDDDDEYEEEEYEDEDDDDEEEDFTPPPPPPPQYAPPPPPPPTYIQPVFVTPPAPQPEPEPTPPPEKSEFVKRMEEIARGNRITREVTTVIREEPAPVHIRKDLSARMRVNNKPVPMASNYDALYTYDPFMNSLTPQEKNEFGDLFIANKYGLTNLPTYVIGGDNAEFFNKVFIYLGRFRENISTELLDKLFRYVNDNS